MQPTLTTSPIDDARKTDDIRNSICNTEIKVVRATMGLGNPVNSRGLARDTGRVAAEHVQDASPKLAARLGSAAGVTKARLQFTIKAGDMRISFGGVYSVAELSKSLDRVAHVLAANGVDEVRGMNLYFTLFRDRRSISLVDDQGVEIDHLKFDEPSPRLYKAVSGEAPDDI